MTRADCKDPTVLVVDDDPAIRESLRDVLEAEGYAVVTAANGKEGLDLLRETRTPCVILLDLMMPVMSGSEFLMVLRSHDVLSDIPVVIVSAWTREAAPLAPLSQGIVRKPVRLDELLACVDRFCCNRRADAG
jgi:CheY-like chemotaxis protein